GVRKIRLTGGEPLLRKNLDRLVGMLAGLRSPAGERPELALTTNGALLRRQAAALRSAGLDRLTVSLDSLDAAIFRRMNDADYPVEMVLDGRDTARRAGIERVKVNIEVKRSVNDDCIVKMAANFRGAPHIVRMFDFMDV